MSARIKIDGIFEDSDRWADLFDFNDHDQLVDVLTEIDWEANDYKTVAEVDETREALAKHTTEELQDTLARFLGTAREHADQVYAELDGRYPGGVITGDNSPYQQWGGRVDDEDGEEGDDGE
jgi:hypothetical protein